GSCEREGWWPGMRVSAAGGWLVLLIRVCCTADSAVRVPCPELGPGPALGEPADQSVTAPPQVWLLKVARAWILSEPGWLAMTFRIVNDPLGPAVVACRETTTAPLSVIRTAHTWPPRVGSSWH